MNRRFLAIDRNRQVQVVLAVALLHVTALAAVADSPRAAGAMPIVHSMGVSSAWTLNEPTTVKAAASALVPAPDTTRSQKISTELKKRIEKQPDIEDLLTSWQKAAKNLSSQAVPKTIAFWNWGMKRLGIGSSAPVPDLTAAPRSTRKINVQSVSNSHPVWLLRDGRLKTVAAH